MPVTGRFAPSPSGSMHLGSLVAAVASFVDARSRGGCWRLRIDDVDTPRIVPGSANDIIETLALFGFRWDGHILFQSEQVDRYKSAIDDLQRRGLAFDCACTRREARRGPDGLEGSIYPGTCRGGVAAGREARSVRVAIVGQPTIELVDEIAGCVRQDLARDIGDFVIRRSDGITAYQLATVLDDAKQDVDRVVRGADLLTSTPRQIYLQRCLGLSQPEYAHTPLLVTPDRDKLCKSSGAKPLDRSIPGRQLHDCLKALGQGPPNGLYARGPKRILDWAIDNWTPSRIPTGPVIP